MEQLGEAIVLGAIVSWPFVIAGGIAAVIVRVVGVERLGRWLRLDVGDQR